MSKMKKPPLDLNTVIEPFGVLEFSSVEGLRQHVIKHCLKESPLLWQKIFTDQDLEAALEAYGTNKMNAPALLEVMEKYRSLLSDIVVKHCEAGRQHLHSFVQYDKMPHQIVETWDYQWGIKIVAKSFVRKGQLQPYVLYSGYHCDCTKKGFRKEIAKRIKEKLYIRNNAKNPIDRAPMTLIADHSGLIQE